jgi:DNA-binding CsgD family transcriptional regulator
MQITHNNRIPGLLTKGIEFIAVADGVVEALHDRQVLSFDQLPAFAYATIKQVMGKMDASLDEMQLFVFKVWGGMDDTEDIDAAGSPGKFEYLTDYAPAYFPSGKKISDAQLRVLKMIGQDDKSIAEKLYLSPYTVARHCRDIYNEIGVKTRTQAALWATKKGII